MHGPTGFTGVHLVPKSLHSGGRMTPFSTSPHLHPAGSFASRSSTPNFFRALYPANSSLSASPLAGISPSPRQAASTSVKTLRITSRAFVLPAGATALEYAFPTECSPAVIILTVSYTAMSISTGSKPATTHGILYFSATGLYASDPITTLT